MAAISTILAGVGLALGAVGTGVQMVAAGKQAEASKRAEKLREQQMNLEGARQRRDIVRNMLKGRAMALSNAGEQGAQFGSGLQGGLAQVTSNAAYNTQGVNQSQQIGAGIFQANRDITGAQELASFGSGLSSFGGSMVNNSQTIGRIATYAGF